MALNTGPIQALLAHTLHRKFSHGAMSAEVQFLESAKGAAAPPDSNSAQPVWWALCAGNQGTHHSFGWRRLPSAQGVWCPLCAPEKRTPRPFCASSLRGACRARFARHSQGTDDANVYCVTCRLNHTIPSLSIAENGILWGRLEDAKRRVISALISLKLPVASRLTEDPEQGLAFDFLISPPGGPRILTGHNDGLITINIEEADPVKREQMRMSMHEPYRTLCRALPS